MEQRIVDTCCLLNLYASREELAIFEHLGGIFVSSHIQREALRIRCVDNDSPSILVPQDIDLSDAIRAGLVTVCQLEGQEELDLFVQFAHRLDDGESSAMALAKSRGWTVATDDKKARRIARDQRIRVVSTSELIHSWVVSRELNDAMVGELLRRVQRFGRFRPGPADSLFAWWNQMIESSDT